MRGIPCMSRPPSGRAGDTGQTGSWLPVGPPTLGAAASLPRPLSSGRRACSKWQR